MNMLRGAAIPMIASQGEELYAEVNISCLAIAATCEILIALILVTCG